MHRSLSAPPFPSRLALALTLLALGAAGCATEEVKCASDADCPAGSACDTALRLCFARGLQGPGPDAGTAPPDILTTGTLPAAYAGKQYTLAAQVQGGTQPLQWSLGQPLPQGLAWLQVDAPSGVLRGTPSAPAAEAAFELRVTDAQDRSDAQGLRLAVLSCTTGDTVACTTPVDGACRLGQQTCAAGTFGACAAGSAASADVNQCGGACAPCGPGANACSGGVCACGPGAACADGITCCGSPAAAGCVNLQTATESCGACGRSCTDPNGDGVSDVPAGTQAACSAGACAYPCRAGFTRCPADGSTCADFTTDAENCGSCGKQCPRANDPRFPAFVHAQAASPACQGGGCQLTCDAGWGNCDANVETGCETSTTDNLQHCGACNRQCTAAPAGGTPVCAGTSCDFVCGGGLTRCGGACVSVAGDVNNCGQCGRVCPGDANGNAVCTNGTCGIECRAGWELCNGVCVNTSLDENHCGECNRRCFGSSVCRSGDCCVACNGQYCCGGSTCNGTSGCTDIP